MSYSFSGERASLNQVARELGVHISTLWRWALRGVRGRKLRTVMIGGRRFVQRCDLESFLNDGKPLSASADRNRRADDAGRMLDSYGVRISKPRKNTSHRASHD